MADPSGAGPSDTRSDGPVPAVTADKINPCTLVTKAEADALAGVKLQKPQRAQSLCIFPTPTSGTVAQLEIYVGDGAAKYYEIDSKDLGHEFQDVPGLGDEAHLEDGAIFVSTKGIWFGLRLTRLDSVDTGPALAKLAAVVAERIQ